MGSSRKILVLLIGVVALSGCARVGYYAHLGKGGLALAIRGQNVEKLLRDPRASADLKARLTLARNLLDFAGAELGLPVEKKYRKYLDLERPFVVWTVVAAPEFSLEPETWCFPVAGCVSYRGFFTSEKADRFAASLREEGLELSVGGVQAFSSLGWFGDPLLNTFIFDEDRRLAGLLFHELAHGLVYAKDDSVFNESFATAVERAGVGRWLMRGSAGAAGATGSAGSNTPARPVSDYLDHLASTDRTYEMIEQVRDRLERLYASKEPDMLARKAELFEELDAGLRMLAEENGSSSADNFAFSGWIGRNVNNADVAGIGLYRRWLDSFEALLEAVDGDLLRFYSGAQCLAELDLEERTRRLAAEEWLECILDGRLNQAMQG